MLIKSVAKVTDPDKNPEAIPSNIIFETNL